MGESAKNQIVISADIVHQMSRLVVLDEHSFKKHFEDKNLGYVLSVGNLMKVMFNDAQKAKNDLLNAYNRMNEKDKKKTDIILGNLYGIMQNLENKYSLIQSMEQERKDLFKLTGATKDDKLALLKNTNAHN